MPYGTWLRIGQSPLRVLRRQRVPAAGFWHVSAERFFASARSGTRAFKKVPKLRRAQSLIGVGLGGSVFLAVAFSKAAAKAGREDEAIWASRRGPLALDAQRAIEFAPLIPCIGSGLVAVTITRMWTWQESNAFAFAFLYLSQEAARSCSRWGGLLSAVLCSQEETRSMWSFVGSLAEVSVSSRPLPGSGQRP